MLHGNYNFSSLTGLLIKLFCIGFWFSFVSTKVFATPFEVEIEKPNSCYEVASIKENKVYLQRKSSCIGPQVITSEKIKLNSWYDVLEIYVNGRLWKEIPLKMISPSEVLKTVKEAEDAAKDLGNFSNVYEDSAKEEAEKAYQATQTPEYQKLVKQYEENLMSLISEKEGVSLKNFYKDYVEKKKSKEKVLVLDPDERLYIFVSSSMPKETIRNYVTFVSSHIEGNVVFVLRGGVGGLKRLMPTISWIYDTIKKDSNCEGLNCEVYGVEFVIDPFLYRRYKVEKVPAIVYAKGKALTEFDISEGLEEKWQTQVWAKTYGDVSLPYHLKVLAEELGIEKLKKFVDELNM
jgi:type-F conjugative transfer system pilin assembly protein TrbC